MLQRVQDTHYPPLTSGTDGFRERVENFSPQGIRRMGQNLAQRLPTNSTYVIARDTRESGVDFQRYLEEGINATNRGIKVEDVGVVPTPLLSYITTHPRIQGGVMITASHNPSHDNGFKFFDEQGRKISKEDETQLRDAYNNSNIHTFNHKKVSVSPLHPYSQESKEKYISQIKSLLEQSQFQGKVAVDCANGATVDVVRDIFKHTKRGLEFELFANTPNGHNINENCGVTSPQFLEQILRRGGYQLGISFDGDGDRVGFVDERGQRIDGDFVLGYLATKLHEEGKLQGRGVVVTQYSNLALDEYLQEQGIEVQRVENGDKAVMAKLRANNWSFGGEHSGHIILDTQIGSGDGIRAGVEVLRHLSPKNLVSEQLNNLYVPNPQIQKNIQLETRISSLKDLSQETQGIIQQATKEVEEVGGRVLIRPSGTEPKLRVLVESPNLVFNKEIVQRINKQF
ncbi:MAG: hypothetical protein LAT82_01550 [Nanoarchaeota archaeon]|nr:hypothetical protein [Nanoarchaeota archaeon]